MKKRKCMADGGMVLAADEKRETVEQMLARMNAKYGTGIPSPAPQPQAPASQPKAPAQQPTSIVDSLRRRNEDLKKAANYARGGVVKPMADGGIAGMTDNLIGGPRYDSPGGAFVWEDGTRRDGLTAQQGAQLDAEIAMNKARAAAGINTNDGASAAPVQTMAEQQIAAGINPNAMYSPGSAADPHASGGMAATAAQKLAYHVMQAQPAINPFDPMAQNRRRKPIAFADGGLIPVNIGHGLYQAIAQPIAEDFRQGARAIKAVRDQYPTADNLAGIHPGIAAAQVANDVLAGNVGGDTAMNVAQAVPMVKGLSGMAKLLSKQAGPTVGDVRLVIDMPSTVRKNTVLTGAQAIGQPENAFADGGMVRFAGKGGPRDDKIPVKVAGEQIRVSDGESAVILPAMTAANPAAVQAIGQIIQATNDGRAPNMGAAGDADRNGMACGGVAGKRKMARGGVIDPEEEKQRNGRPPTAQEVYGPAYRGVAEALRGGTATSPTSAPTAQEVYRDASLSGMVGAVTPKGGISDHPIYSGVSASGMADALRNWRSTATPTASQAAQATPRASSPITTATPSAATVVRAAPTAVATARAPTRPPVPEVVPWYAGTDTRDERTGLQQELGRVAAGQGLADHLRDLNGPSLLTTAVLGEGKPPASGMVVAPQRGGSQRTGPTSAEADRAIERDQAVDGTMGQRIAATTGNAGDAEFFPNNGRLSFVNKGLDVERQQLADGTGMMHRARDGKTILFANMDPNQYTGADGTPNQRWEKTQAYADAQGRLQADKLRLAEMQATRLGMNPVQAIAATQGMAQAAQKAQNDQELAQQAISTGRFSLRQAQELNDLYAAHKAATTPEEQARIAEAIRVRTGKEKPDEYAHAAGGTTVNPATMMVEKTPDVIYSRRTGKAVNTGGATAAFSKAEVDAAIKAGADKAAVAARIKSMGQDPKQYGL